MMIKKAWRKLVKRNLVTEKYEELKFIIATGMFLACIIIVLDIVVTDDTRWTGVLVEAHGVLAEFLLVGVVLAGFLISRNHRQLKIGEPILAAQSLKTCSIIIETLTYSEKNDRYKYIHKQHSEQFVYIFKSTGIEVFSSFAFNEFNQKNIEAVENHYKPDKEHGNSNEDTQVDLTSRVNIELRSLKANISDIDCSNSDDKQYKLERLHFASNILAESIGLASNLLGLGYSHRNLLKLYQLQFLVWEIIRGIEIIPEYMSNNPEIAREARSSIFSMEDTIVDALFLGLKIANMATKDTDRITKMEWRKRKSKIYRDAAAKPS